MSQPDPIFVSIKEASRLLSLSRYTIYGLLDDQAIASHYEGRRRLVDYASLVEYAKGLPTTPTTAESA